MNSEMYRNLAEKLLVSSLDVVKKILREIDPGNPSALEGFYAAYRNDWNLRIQGVDIVGTGGDGKNTFNISTAASFVCAGYGIPVVKFGNRSATSSSGSIDVLSALGIKLSRASDEVNHNLEKANLAFISASDAYPVFAKFSSVRKELGKPTIFNYIGPLLNPIGTSLTVLGVSRANMVRTYIDFFEKIKKGCVCITSDGFDEAMPFQLSNIHSQYGKEEISPLREGRLEDLIVTSPNQSAETIFNILNKTDKSIRYNCVTLNAGIAIAQFNGIDLTEGVRSAEETIDSGNAYKILRKLQTI